MSKIFPVLLSLLCSAVSFGQLPSFFFVLSEDGSPQSLSAPVRYSVNSHFLSDEELLVSEISRDATTGRVSAALSGSAQYHTYGDTGVEALLVSTNGGDLVDLRSFDLMGEQLDYDLGEIELTEGLNTVGLYLECSAADSPILVVWSLIVNAETNEDFEVVGVEVEEPQIISSDRPPTNESGYGIGFRSRSDLAGYTCRLPGISDSFHVTKHNGDLYVLTNSQSESDYALFTVKPAQEPLDAPDLESIEFERSVLARADSPTEAYLIGYTTGMALRGVQFRARLRGACSHRPHKR